ncbi:MAG: hydroxymyristoyl-ACP dehydratase [Bacteroidales bacterium]|nr:hydroxymyristoyl-ACP dehydratase [Bacteroidales bacterium]
MDGKEQICKYIPQREPIVMVDKLYSFEADRSETGLTIDESSIFVEDGRLADGALIEHTAQSGALHIGYDFVMRGQKVPIGLIGSINKYSITRLPRVGESVRTSIAIEARVGDVSLIGITVRVGDEVIAQGKMKVATPE